MFLCQQEQKQDLRLLLEFFGQNFPKCQFCLKFWPVMTYKTIRQKCYSFYWNMKKWLIVRVFFVYTLFHPMIYAPRFCQMKGLIKLCICGEFYQYSECGCEVKIFKVFWIDSDPWNGPFLGGGVGARGLGPYSPNYSSVLLKFWAGVFSNKTNTVLENPLKCWILAQMECNQSL